MRNKKLIAVVLTTALTAAMSTTALANEIPTIDDKDFSNSGALNYTYENGYIIESRDITDEEKEIGQALQKLHTHTDKEKHFSITPHSHSIKNIKSGSDKSTTWRPTETWTRNSLYQNSSNWPTVAWSTGVSKTESASVSTSVGVTDSVVSASLGTNYTKSHTISTSTTRTFKVPYKKDGRVKVTYSRPYKTFTCVTTYVVAGPPLVQWDETGSGSALGKPTNIVCNLETRSF